jgi:catechol 2,3-dioxygenase-like lactoylglutathione lyase family enzyme
MTEPRELRIVLTVDDFDTALEVYTGVLGLRQLEDYSAGTGRAVLLDAGRATIELADPDHAAHVDRLEVGRRVAGRIRLTFEVTDVASTTDALVARGASLVAPPTPTPWDTANSRLESSDGIQLTLWGRPDSGAVAVPQGRSG